MHKAVDENGVVLSVTLRDDSIVAGRRSDTVASTENEFAKRFDVVDCRVAIPRAAATRRFLVIMIVAYMGWYVFFNS